MFLSNKPIKKYTANRRLYTKIIRLLLRKLISLTDIATAVFSDAASYYQNDEATANKKYLNKVIEVTGNIADIQNVNGSQIILLSTKDEMGGVNCQLSNSEKDKDITLKKSTTITIKGRCSGYLMDVNLVDCILK